MSRVTDPVLLSIVEGTSTGGLPPTTAKAVHYTAHLLLAACDLSDVSAFAEPHTSDGRHIVPVLGKWGLSFVMGNAGPDDIRLEKLAKSWPAKSSRSSRPHRPAKR